MFVITDITIPAEEFALGRVLTEYPEVKIHLERLVPVENAVMPLFWVEGGDEEKIRQTLTDDELVESISKLTESNGDVLYEIRWRADINGLVSALFEQNVRVMEATGTADEWDFRLQFSNRENLYAFRQELRKQGIRMQLRRLYNPSFPKETDTLTAEQYDAILAAYENGYWKIPRGVTLDELAKQIGVSDNAVSQRLRRGIEALVRETVIEKPP